MAVLERATLWHLDFSVEMCGGFARKAVIQMLVHS